MMKYIRWIVFCALLMIPTQLGLAQDTAPLPRSHQLTNVGFEYQGWNNCGPATITNALSYFGYRENQDAAAAYLKPTDDDKNVSPWQMVNFVNEQTPRIAVQALTRSGGDLELLKTLVSNNFPVIIEKGYDPEPDRLGWMGHYLLVIGYDEASQVFITHDSYLGPNYNYSYDYIQEFWQHFNYTYIVLYQAPQIDRVHELLGDDADEFTNAINSFTIAQNEARTQPDNAFAYFNMGTNLVRLAEIEAARGNGDVSQQRYAAAAQAYDQARGFGLPFRMLWYQFGPFEAYYATERYNDMLTLARANINDGGGDEIEETYYYGGLARAALGETDRAIRNLEYALQWNPNFTPAAIALAELQ